MSDNNTKVFDEWTCRISAKGSFCTDHKVSFKPSNATRYGGKVIRCPAGEWQEHSRRLAVESGIFKRAMFELQHYAPVDAWFRRHKIDPARLKPRGK